MKETEHRSQKAIKTATAAQGAVPRWRRWYGTPTLHATTVSPRFGAGGAGIGNPGGSGGGKDYPGTTTQFGAGNSNLGTGLF